MNMSDRDRLVIDYLHLAEKLASKKTRKVNKRVQFEELKSAAYFGLLDAASKFDETKNASFPSYARWRINGEINDYLRKCNWGKRNHPMYSRSLDVPVYKNSYHKASSLENELTASDDLMSKLGSKDFFEKITRCLPKKVRRIFFLYYIANETMQNISKEIELSESRVSQLIKQYLQYLNDVWCNRTEELWEELALSRKGGMSGHHKEFKMQHYTPTTPQVRCDE